MSNPEALYSDVPPTKLRNRNEKFRPARITPFWRKIADLFFYNMLENRFHSMLVKNEELFENRNKDVATIFYAPHGNWWDGIVGYNMLRRVFHHTVRMMVEEMNRFPLFSRAGAFPVNKRSPQEAMKSLKYAIDDLGQNPDHGLWIFPQGIIKPPNYRPFEFQTGMTYIAEKVAQKYGAINMVPIAVAFAFLREDSPEVLVEVGQPITLTREDVKNLNRHEFTHKLEKEFTELCDNQLKNISQGNFTGYRHLFLRKLHWYRRLEKKLKGIGMKGSGI
ncbi:MAG: lysophospholipid acyltransferase family protein [Candidatus Gastranaerophilaceae bacterium]